MPYRMRNWVLAAVGSLLFTGACYGQIPASDTAIVRGKVVDPNQAAIEGAEVIAVADERRYSTRTNLNGEFSINLEPGKYSFRINAIGFSEAVRIVEIKQTGVEYLDLMLPVAGSNDIVTITEPAEYQTESVISATKTLTPLRDIPQSITVVGSEQIRDQSLQSIADVVNYVPGVSSHQGENNRDQLVIRGNSTSADFYLNGVRDDVQYYRDLYNVERLEVLKGPNAMIFGRGGGGGVVNRVSKEAGFSSLREFSFQGGSYNNKRLTMDLDQPFSDQIAFRFNTLYENSGSFRDHVSLQRYGFNPTLTLAAGSNTKLTLSYEHFHDGRTADRGIPSFQGRPIGVPIFTYFGDPDNSHVRARVDLVAGSLEYIKRSLTIRNRTQFGNYDRGYQNYVPGAVNATKTQFALTAYNNATTRRNLFNQTDLIYQLGTGTLRHTLLAGAELGRQLTDNFRNTGFFNNTSTTIQVPLSDSIINTPVTFRQSATDADNHLRTQLGAAYVQDQIELTRYFLIVTGLRFDYFDLKYHNNRNGDTLRRIDRLVSPRTGIVFKPLAPVSIYGSFSVSYLPSSGDQFSSLTVITQQVKPEKFTNYELGVKLDVLRNLWLTTSLYRQDRTNTRSTDPNDPTRIVQTGSQRTNGFEFELNGSLTKAWQVVAGYSYQNAFITSATIAAPVGAQVPQVPHSMASLWNNYRILRKLSVGLGVIHRSNMFAAIDNTVVLEGYTRFDAAVYVPVTERIRLQANVDNLFNRRCYVNADNNNNISPGKPREIRLSLVANF